jgi:nitrogen PTS system EIIA component
MYTLLDALQEGRLIELPDNDKTHSLHFLSHILEAVPSLPSNTDVSGSVLKREESFNTAIGQGFAVPHARVPFEGDLICAVGWSPAGIAYGAPDGLPVHIVFMFIVPENQRNQYLKEISLIAKTLQELHKEPDLASFSDLNTVRNYLLDIITEAKDVVGPDARARMIRLEIRETETTHPALPVSNLLIEPLTIIKHGNQQSFVLTQNKELFDALDNNVKLAETIEIAGFYDVKGWRVVKNKSFVYQNDRTLLECVGVKFLSKPN